MKNGDSQKAKFSWNDRVIIKGEAPLQFRPGKIGLICGMSEIEFEEIASKYRSKVGEWIYTIEFEDGSSNIVPEHCIEFFNSI